MARWKLLGIAPALALMLWAGAAEAQVAKCTGTAAARTSIEGQPASLSCDLSGNLRTTGSAGLSSTQLPAALGSQADALSLGVAQSTEDKAVQANIKTAVEALAAALNSGILKVMLYTSGAVAVGWDAPATGTIGTPVAVSTSTSVWPGTDATAREVFVRNPSTSTANVVCALAASAVTVANGFFEIPPGQTMTTGKDGYTGEIRCIAVTGTQTVAVGKVN